MHHERHQILGYVLLALLLFRRKLNRYESSKIRKNMLIELQRNSLLT